MSVCLDGFVIRVLKDKLADTRRMARKFGALWIKCGALEVHECAAGDVKPGKLTSSPQACGGCKEMARL
jgi:uncharacterized protein YbaA (DUF1428 family)